MTELEVVSAPDDLVEFNAWALRRRWGDGLPLVPPTASRVDAMIAGTTWPRHAVIASIPARYVDATVETIAVNAVMAGCAPTAMPILIAAVQAAADPEMNLYGSQATTHPSATMLLVSGALASKAEVQAGAGLYGPPSRGGATIGRAIRLILQNVGGAWPGETDRSTQATPAKFTFCFAENEAESPWSPHRVALGFDSQVTTVTVATAEGPHNLNDHVSLDAKGILSTFAQSIAVVGVNNAYCRNGEYFVVLCPEHAHVLAREGFERRDVQEYLHERARIPFRQWRNGAMFDMLPRPKYLDVADDDLQVRMTDRLEDVRVLVGGGPGRHSSWIPTFAAEARSVTMPVTDPNGRAVEP